MNISGQIGRAISQSLAKPKTRYMRYSQIHILHLALLMPIRVRMRTSQIHTLHFQQEPHDQHKILTPMRMRTSHRDNKMTFNPKEIHRSLAKYI